MPHLWIQNPFFQTIWSFEPDPSNCYSPRCPEQMRENETGAWSVHTKSSNDHQSFGDYDVNYPTSSRKSLDEQPRKAASADADRDKRTCRRQEEIYKTSRRWSLAFPPKQSHVPSIMDAGNLQPVSGRRKVVIETNNGGKANRSCRMVTSSDPYKVQPRNQVTRRTQGNPVQARSVQLNLPIALKIPSLIRQNIPSVARSQ